MRWRKDYLITKLEINFSITNLKRKMKVKMKFSMSLQFSTTLGENLLLSMLWLYASLINFISCQVFILICLSDCPRYRSSTNIISLINKQILIKLVIEILAVHCRILLINWFLSSLFTIISYSFDLSYQLCVLNKLQYFIDEELFTISVPKNWAPRYLGLELLRVIYCPKTRCQFSPSLQQALQMGSFTISIVWKFLLRQWLVCKPVAFLTSILLICRSFSILATNEPRWTRGII